LFIADEPGGRLPTLHLYFLFRYGTLVRGQYISHKIIAITGGGRFSSYDYLKMAMTLGAIHVLTKPFRAEELLKKVTEFLGSGLDANAIC
jgi:YesN/AraC family two-component response regulator